MGKLAPGEYRGKGWIDAIHPADAAMVVAAFSELMSALRPFQMEYKLRRHDGRYRYVLARGVPVFADDSSVKEWVGTCRLRRFPWHDSTAP